MTAPLFDDPSQDEQFYARALAILAGPSRRMARTSAALQPDLLGWR